MAAHWRTESIMDNPLTRPSAHSLQRPQVFVKVEFGVSWSPQHPPRPRGFQYRSRALRERAPYFPRHVPAPTTNYLTASSIQQFQQAQVPQFYEQRSLEQSQPHQRPTQPEQARQQRQPRQEDPRSRSRQVGFAPAPEEPVEEEQRTSRDERRGSGERHGRGRSAPPPLSDNNWDVVHPQLMADNQAGSSAAYAAADRPVSDVWKDLPEVPSRFRLGEEGMPWESWEAPMGWEPYLDPDPFLQPPSSHASPDPQHSQEAQRQPSGEEASTSPTIIQIESPIESPRYRREDPERVRELEALGSAMMTVDNGFENQWWNSGERQPMATALYPPPTTRDHVREQLALGWAMAHMPPESSSTAMAGTGAVSVLSGEPGTATLNNAVVSPVSSYSGPEIQPGLSRSLSTRSDELWFTGARYA
jgi:hypothetical protein